MHKVQAVLSIRHLLFAWGPKISELANDPTYGGNTDNSYTSQYGKQSGKYYVPQLAAAGMNPVGYSTSI